MLVVTPRLRFDEIMEDCHIPIGGCAKFSVVTSGSPAPQVTWSLNDQIFGAGDENVKIDNEKNGKASLTLINWATQGRVRP